MATNFMNYWVFAQKLYSDRWIFVLVWEHPSLNGTFAQFENDRAHESNHTYYGWVRAGWNEIEPFCKLSWNVCGACSGLCPTDDYLCHRCRGNND